MVFVMGWVTNIEVMWDDPGFARLLDRLASFSRLILFDKRGVGLSDRVPEDRLPDLETRMDDVRAVMDAVGSERAVVFGVSEGGPMSMLFAATYPERTIALALFGTVADFTVRDARLQGGPGGVPRADGGVVGQPRVRAGRDRGLGRARSRVRRTAGRVARVVHAEVGQSGCGGRPRAHEPRDQRHPCPPVDPRAHAGDRQGRGHRLPHRRGAGHGEPDRRRQARRAPGERALALGRRPGRDRRRGAALRGRARRGGGGARPGAGDRAVHRRRRLHREGRRARRSRAGRSWSRSTTGGCAASSPGTAAWRSTRRATGSSPRSTARRGRSGARGRSSTRSPRWASRSGRACTPARSRRSTGRSAGWPW